MEVLASVDDYCVLKLEITSSLTGVPVTFKKSLKKEDLVALTPGAKSIVMKTSSDFLTHHVPMMRLIASQSCGDNLIGRDEIERAQIDQWLEYCWQELEVPVQTLLSLLCNDKLAQELTTSQVGQVTTKASSDLKDHMTILEDHISSRTFIVGERLSLSDVSLFAVLSVVFQHRWVQSVAYPSLTRWFCTVGSIPAVERIAGNSEIYFTNSVTTTLKSTPASLWDRHRTRVKELLQEGVAALGKEVVLKGWVRTCRQAEKGELWFVELTDGSTVKGIQLVVSNSLCPTGVIAVAECGGAGASLSVTGTVAASPAKGQVMEISVTRCEVLGPVYGGENGEIGGKNYPMAKKQHTLEFLREKAHLRPRSKVFSSAMRMRSAMAFATHKFFNERSFVYVHTPLITAADCEGAGEQFVVTTLLPEHAKLTDVPTDKKGAVDFSKDFFGRRCCMTVSGQLNVETHACALSDVYTFGPTFRAENSHTARHLAEFWMIEPEICFAELIDDMALAEDYVKYCATYALEHCAEDLHYFEHEYPAGEKGLQARLQNVVDNAFARITYTEAVALLQTHVKDGKVKFLVYPNWGDDLGSEHERYITEQVFAKPTIVINYPKGIKAFYMKLNDDKETVAAMDILVPKIGELIGGSQREDNLVELERRCRESGMKPEDIWWYADLRRYGSVPHAGFGLGFERLVMFVTGLENIRDVIPFPRVPGHAEF